MLIRSSVVASREGWIAQARWITAAAPRKHSARSAVRTSASTQRVFGGSHAGRRRAMPTISSISPLAPRASTTLVPTLPVAPVTTTFTVSSSLASCLPDLPAADAANQAGKGAGQGVGEGAPESGAPSLPPGAGGHVWRLGAEHVSGRRLLLASREGTADECRMREAAVEGGRERVEDLQQPPGPPIVDF